MVEVELLVSIAPASKFRAEFGAESVVNNPIEPFGYLKTIPSPKFSNIFRPSSAGSIIIFFVRLGGVGRPGVPPNYRGLVVSVPSSPSLRQGF
jgi:hypothetical protein